MIRTTSFVLVLVCFAAYAYADSEDVDPCLADPCEPGESCVSEGSSFTCVSPCEPENPCFNDGTCQVVDGGYICICPPGFSGDNCLGAANDPCDPNPCENDATCLVVGDGYECVCPPGFTGVHCELLIGDECCNDCSGVTVNVDVNVGSCGNNNCGNNNCGNNCNNNCAPRNNGCC